MTISRLSCQPKTQARIQGRCVKQYTDPPLLLHHNPEGKSEGRIPKPDPLRRRGSAARGNQKLEGPKIQNGQFGFRTSGFFRISTFGFRTSKMALSRGFAPRTSAFAERRAELITP